MARAWRQGSAFLTRLLAVPLGLAGALVVGWGLIRGLLSLSVNSRVAQILLALGALFLVVEALVACWDRQPAPVRRRLRTSWRWRSRWLLRSRPLSLWPVVLVLLTALLGFADWFPAPGWSRPMILGVIATVGIYGYFREKADQKKALVAFADVARYRFAEEAERLIEATERRAQERERSNQERNRADRQRNRADRQRNRADRARNRDLEASEQSARLSRIKRFRQDR